jgi:hypothetical protein
MDEFGETHKIYVWPADHEDGDPFPDDFYDRLNTALAVAGFEWESV